MNAVKVPNKIRPVVTFCMSISPFLKCLTIDSKRARPYQKPKGGKVEFTSPERVQTEK